MVIIKGWVVMSVRDVGSTISVVVVVRAVGVLEAVALNFIIASRISSLITYAKDELVVRVVLCFTNFF